MSPASTVIAVAALLFTVATFWWLNARRGKLVISRPDAFSCAFVKDRSRLRFPLVFYNTGARAIVVDALRIRIHQPGVVYRWITFRSTLRPEEDDVVDFTHAFPVPGRGAVSKFIEFGEVGDRGLWAPTLEEVYDVELEARTDRATSWKSIGSFKWRVPAFAKLPAYIGYDNDVGDG